MIGYPVVIGDCTEERTVLLASLPSESPAGTFIRALWVLAEPLSGDPSHYWKLVLGRFGVAGFEATWTIPFPQGFPVGPRRVALEPEVRVSRGDMVALRVSPTSSAASPLSGLSVMPEFADSGARAR